MTNVDREQIFKEEGDVKTKAILMGCGYEPRTFESIIPGRKGRGLLKDPERNMALRDILEFGPLVSGTVREYIP